MAVLNSTSTKQIFFKKLKGSSLMEVIVATIIIVLVFGMVTLILNNILQTKAKQDTYEVELVLNKSIYAYQHHQLALPYQDKINDWDINTEEIKIDNINYIVFKAIQEKTNKEITKVQIVKREKRNPY